MTHATDRIPLNRILDLIQIGRPLPFKVLDSQGRLLLNAGQTLSDQTHADALIERGAWAERATVESERLKVSIQGSKPKAQVLSLFDRWESLLWAFDKLTRSLIRRAAPDGAVQDFFISLRELIDIDPDVALFLSIRPANRRFALYPLTHALNCAVTCTLVARQLRWDDAKAQSTACAALTMNLSIQELQATMAEQDTPPTKKQLELIRAHPEASVTLLRGVGIADEEWLGAVAQHHEHSDGGGYPNALKDIAEPAQLVHMTDVYMAKISPRVNRPGILPQVAARQLFQEHAGDPLALAAIKTLGVHPPGALVQLRSGEWAVVTRRSASGPHPTVATLTDRTGKPSLQTHVRDSAQPEFTIQAALPEDKNSARLLPERVYGYIKG